MTTVDEVFLSYQKHESTQYAVRQAMWTHYIDSHCIASMVINGESDARIAQYIRDTVKRAAQHVASEIDSVPRYMAD